MDIELDIRFDITAAGYRVRAMRGEETVVTATGPTIAKVCEELGFWLTQWMKIADRDAQLGSSGQDVS